MMTLYMSERSTPLPDGDRERVPLAHSSHPHTTTIILTPQVPYACNSKLRGRESYRGHAVQVRLCYGPAAPLASKCAERRVVKR